MIVAVAYNELAYVVTKIVCRYRGVVKKKLIGRCYSEHHQILAGHNRGLGLVFSVGGRELTYESLVRIHGSRDKKKRQQHERDVGC